MRDCLPCTATPGMPPLLAEAAGLSDGSSLALSPTAGIAGSKSRHGKQWQPLATSSSSGSGARWGGEWGQDREEGAAGCARGLRDKQI